MPGKIRMKNPTSDRGCSARAVNAISRWASIDSRLWLRSTDEFRLAEPVYKVLRHRAADPPVGTGFPTCPTKKETA
jgi:hypothetical protein